MEAAVKDLLPPMEGAPKELLEEFLLPMEREEVEDLPTPPEGRLKDLLPPTEGAPEELPEGLLLPVEGGVKDLLRPPPLEGGLKDLLPPVEGTLEWPSKPLRWLAGLSPESWGTTSPRFPQVADGLSEPLVRLLEAAGLFPLLEE